MSMDPLDKLLADLQSPAVESLGAQPSLSFTPPSTAIEVLLQTIDTPNSGPELLIDFDPQNPVDSLPLETRIFSELTQITASELVQTIDDLPIEQLRPAAPQATDRLNQQTLFPIDQPLVSLDKQQRLEALQSQRRAEIAQYAQAWLSRLNAHSSEGQWFDEFACNYGSRLEAAIDYLEALNEVSRYSSLSDS